MITPSWSKNTAFILDILTPCHCEEGDLPDEAISCFKEEIASGKEQERPRNDINYFFTPKNSRTVSTKSSFSSFEPIVTRNQPSDPYFLLSPRRMMPLVSAYSKTSLPVLPVSPQSKRM